MFVVVAAGVPIPMDWRTKAAIGSAAVVTGGAAVLAAPLVLAGAGFTAGGVAAGSAAAAWQASIGRNKH